jgi:hypothetical protein
MSIRVDKEESELKELETILQVDSRNKRTISVRSRRRGDRSLVGLLRKNKVQASSSFLGSCSQAIYHESQFSSASTGYRRECFFCLVQVPHSPVSFQGC